MNLKDLRGRITVVLTPELRRLALDQIERKLTVQTDPERVMLLEWFRVEETPDGSVLDAAYSEAEATMIDVLLRAVLDMYEPPEDAIDPDAEIRLLTR